MFAQLMRRVISEPFWVLRYEIAGRVGIFASEAGEIALLANVRDPAAADREARAYLSKTALVGGECRYTITRQPWWMRLRLVERIQEAME